MLKKLLKSKKPNYFLEIDDSSGQSNGKAAAKSPEPAKTEAKPVAAKAKPEAKAPEAPKAKKAEAPKAQTQAPAPSQPAKPQPAPQPKQRKEFSTRYLMPNAPTPRRRPGANMKSFLDMAKDPSLRR